MTADPWALGAFLTYLLLILGVGALSARAAGRGMSDYFIGGRQMNRYVVALSAVVSGRSAWLLLGMTGIAWSRGASAVWAVVGYVAVEFALFWSYGRRLRRFAGAWDCITLPDFFAARLGDPRGHLRALVALVILAFMLSYVAAQFVAGGKAFSAGFGVDPSTGVLLTAGIVAIYTLFGGFLAVSLTDMLQAGLMILALMALPLVAISDLGGLGQVLAELQAIDPTLVDPTAISLGGLVGFLGIGLGSPGNPHILSRYMSIADAEQLKTAAWVGTLWNALMAAGALLIGLAGRVAFPEAGLLLDGDTENLYPALAQAHLPPALFGAVLASIFAAIMSTADSQLLVGASSLVRDLYEQCLRRAPLEPDAAVRLSRLAVLGLVAAALLLGWLASDLVFWLVLFAWAGLGAALGPTSILALYWRRTTRAGVIAGLLVGAGVTFGWYYTPALKGALYELVPAFFAGGLATALVSALTAPPEDVDEKMASMR